MKYLAKWTDEWDDVPFIDKDGYEAQPYPEKAILVINEQHILLPQQEELLKERFDEIVPVKIPSSGITKDDVERYRDEIASHLVTEWDAIIIVSPVPILIKAIYGLVGKRLSAEQVLMMVNDHREKKELPGGRVIFTVAKEGWYLY